MAQYAQASNKIAVIGIGNTLRRDDGIGMIVLEALLKSYKKEGLDYLNFTTASFDLLNCMRDYDTVLLIDAINASLRTGEVRIFRLGDIKYNLDSPTVSTHEFNLKNIFELTKEFGVKTKIYVAGIQVEDTFFGESLSEALKNQLDSVIREINVFIDKNLCAPQYQK